MIVRELELDLDAFEGPFDLLLTLVLREELELAEVDVAEIVLAFCERLEERGRLDLDAWGSSRRRSSSSRSWSLKRPPRSWRGGSPTTDG